MGLLLLEFPSLSNGSRRDGDCRHQEQLTGAEGSLTQQQAFSGSAGVTSGQGQDACVSGCFQVHCCGQWGSQWVATSGLPRGDGEGDFLYWRMQNADGAP